MNTFERSDVRSIALPFSTALLQPLDWCLSFLVGSSSFGCCITNLLTAVIMKPSSRISSTTIASFSASCVHITCCNTSVVWQSGGCAASSASSRPRDSVDVVRIYLEWRFLNWQNGIQPSSKFTAGCSDDVALSGLRKIDL